MLPLTDTTNKANADDNKTAKDKTRPAREKKERGPPADGIASKTKVMVANLPYDLTEEKVQPAPLPIHLSKYLPVRDGCLPKHGKTA